MVCLNKTKQNKKQKRIKPIESSSRIIVVNSNRAAAERGAPGNQQHQDLITKIINEASTNSNSESEYELDDNNEVFFLFMDRLADSGQRSRCDASMLRSDVQTRVKQLKSIVSSCPLYCRLAVSALSGLAYGARHFNLESKYHVVL